MSIYIYTSSTHYSPGLQIARLRMIFRPLQPFGKHGERYARKHLAYVEWFERGPMDLDTKMYPVHKARTENREIKSDIVELEQIVQPCALSPRYTESPAVLASSGVTSENCLDVVEDFWVNSFHTKALYQTIF